MRILLSLVRSGTLYVGCEGRERKQNKTNTLRRVHFEWLTNCERIGKNGHKVDKFFLPLSLKLEIPPFPPYLLQGCEKKGGVFPKVSGLMDRAGTQGSNKNTCPRLVNSACQ